jgi:hypothetical protein
MHTRRLKLLVPVLLASMIPATAVLAQAPPPARPARPSADTLARLQDGRIAMAKEALKLNADQLKLWAPVEAHIRASNAARQAAWQQRQERRQPGAANAPVPLPDRLDRASEMMAKRAERMQAFAAVFKPFYASLSDEQKAVAGVVLREMRGGPGPRGRHRWATRQAPDAKQQ